MGTNYENELLPCPFCGRKAKFISYEMNTSDMVSKVECKNCTAQAEFFIHYRDFQSRQKGKQSALTAWNTRTVMPKITEPFAEENITKNRQEPVKQIKAVDGAVIGLYIAGNESRVKKPRSCPNCKNPRWREERKWSNPRKKKN
jgi:Lar family restriction alleviation protein